jgi:hypothetical protein
MQGGSITPKPGGSITRNRATAPGSWNCCRSGVSPLSVGAEPTQVACKDHARRTRARPFGVALAAPRRSEVEVCAGSIQPVPEQHRGAGSPGYQTALSVLLGLKSLRTAAVTLSGIELAHRIRKRQFRFGPGNWRSCSLKQQWERALAG